MTMQIPAPMPLLLRRAEEGPQDLVGRIQGRVADAVEELEALRRDIADLAVVLAAPPAPPPTVAPRLLTVGQAAAALGVGSSTVHHLIRTGQLGSRKLGGSRRVPVEDLDSFVAQLPSQGIGD